jgi:hypothetical protein
MPLMILDMDLDLLVETPVDEVSSQLLEAQWARLKESTEARDAFGRRVGSALSAALTDCVDWDLRPPSTAQVAFATAISRTLGVVLPVEALRHRGPMGEFLDKHSDDFRSVTSRKSKGDGTQ